VDCGIGDSGCDGRVKEEYRREIKDKYGIEVDGTRRNLLKLLREGYLSDIGVTTIRQGNEESETTNTEEQSLLEWFKYLDDFGIPAFQAIEFAENYGKPIYKHTKFLPGGPALEGFIGFCVF